MASQPRKTVARFIDQPAIEKPADESPPCYINVEKCNTDADCMWTKYGQLRTVYKDVNSSCIAPPSSWSFPKAVGSSGGTDTTSSRSLGGSTGASDLSNSTTSAALGTTAMLPVEPHIGLSRIVVVPRHEVSGPSSGLADRCTTWMGELFEFVVSEAMKPVFTAVEFPNSQQRRQ